MIMIDDSCKLSCSGPVLAGDLLTILACIVSLCCVPLFNCVQHASSFQPHVWLGQPPLATVHSTGPLHIGLLRGRSYDFCGSHRSQVIAARLSCEMCSRYMLAVSAVGFFSGRCFPFVSSLICSSLTNRERLCHLASGRS